MYNFLYYTARCTPTIILWILSCIRYIFPLSIREELYMYVYLLDWLNQLTNTCNSLVPVSMSFIVFVQQVKLVWHAHTAPTTTFNFVDYCIIVIQWTIVYANRKAILQLSSQQLITISLFLIRKQQKVTSMHCSKLVKDYLQQFLFIRRDQLLYTYMLHHYPSSAP